MIIPSLNQSEGTEIDRWFTQNSDQSWPNASRLV